MPMIFDVAMSQLIRQRLQQDKRTAGMTVDISCVDGCISLIGHADSEEEKTAALFIIEGLAGVRSVMDQIVIRTR